MILYKWNDYEIMKKWIKLGGVKSHLMRNQILKTAKEIKANKCWSFCTSTIEIKRIKFYKKRT